MSIEEAIKHCETQVKMKEENGFTINNYILATAIEEVLNLIKSQQKKIEHLENINKHQSKDIKKAVDYTFELNEELEKKDKIIDEMSMYFGSGLSMCEDCEKCFESEDIYKCCQECIKQYFEKKVEGK